jgi:5S rRNA maturation endonuclease (ribonuclease M5)
MVEYGTGATAFDLVFPDLVMGENTVLCPFHSESTPSMQINTMQKIFHCFGCGAHGTENDFISRYYGIGRGQTSSFKETLFRSDSILDYERFARSGGEYKANFTYLELKKLGVSDRVLEELKVGSEVFSKMDEDTGDLSIAPSTTSTRLVFPIIMKDRVLDLRTYTADSSVKPKSTSKSGAPAGLVLPYHLWENDTSITVICEGEKDMAIARTHGFNAISLGGCRNLPTHMLECFKDRQVCIVYDNDTPGKAGAKKLASALYSVTKHVYIADIGEWVKEDKEDITDFFVKYKYTNDQFEELLENAKIFDAYAQEEFIKESYPEVSLNEASTTYLGKTVRSNVQVMATFEEQYSVPSYAVFTKENVGGKEEFNRKHKGDTEYWSLQKSNFEDVLVLTDNNLRKNQIHDNLKAIVGWGSEEYVKVSTANPKTVFKASVADCTESVIIKDVKRTEFVCYTDEKLEAGKNYQIIYKVVPHPYRGQQQVLIVSEIKESGDVVTSFEVTPDVVADLSEFQKYGFKDLVEKQKAYVKFNVDSRLLEFIDLWYHTPKEFDFGYMKNIRGYLDGLIVTESRVGKSTTAQALSKVYGIGSIASLAGSAATSAGLVGGSVKAGSSSQIRPGLIPRNHGKAIIFEELAKAKFSLMPELTDIRSSGIVRINRSTGDLSLPASVRILFLTNPRTEDDGMIRPIMAYPNGIEIVKPLIGAIEDIARFDFIYILGENPSDVDPLWAPPEGFTEKQLRNRIYWIWSRKCDQIKISPEMQKYIVDISKKLNDKYAGSVKIFSTETWKKIARMAIAIAGYMVSTDAAYSSIIVQKKHVDIAAILLESIYNNSTFKLKEFIDEERKQLVCTLPDIELAREFNSRYPTMMAYLEKNNNVAKNTLATIAGLDQTIFNDALKQLAKHSFVTMTQFKIFPTPKLLIAMKRLSDLKTGSSEV